MRIYQNLTLGTFDLHMHSTFSDGKFTPEELVEMAKNLNLSTIALTDHDTLAGYPRMKQAAEAIGIRVIPGVEISTSWKEKNVDVLGYEIQDVSWLDSQLAVFREARLNRAGQIIEKLGQMGMSITLEDVKRYAKEGVIARPHIARALVEKGYAFSVQEVFEHYLGDGLAADVPKKQLPLQEGIELIRKAGGIAVLAHPIYLEKMVDEILTESWDGIEVWHRNHTPADAKRFAEMAEKHGLIMTGGSDYHDTNHQMGKFS
ncbi:PHP domain-containing protein [Risungbinella massiliensis]|uniref:PHP domain-containing protein n=1 Tax=Risungbinella massiliensis TaxID=1329796 RepID=UPI0005CBD3B5|nr:PHP domain-containing protein [Risungbinella massiliensis]